MIHIYTDGACRGNPSAAAGFGALFEHNGRHLRMWGGNPTGEQQTSVRMEYYAALYALRRVKDFSGGVVVFSDSELLVKTMMQWAPRWKLRGWRKVGNKPIANPDLVVPIYDIVSEHGVLFLHVRGHSGIPQNEEVDRLANLGCDLPAGEVRLEYF